MTPNKGFAAMALSAALLALGGCMQVERGYIAKPPLRIAAQDVAVYAHQSATPAGYTHIDDLVIEYEDFQRDKMLARLRTAAGVRGANAIILDRDFPTVRGTRDFGGIHRTDLTKQTGATAIFIGTPPPPRIIRPL